jgi:hypothetical protein
VPENRSAQSTRREEGEKKAVLAERKRRKRKPVREHYPSPRKRRQSNPLETLWYRVAKCVVGGVGVCMKKLNRTVWNIAVIHFN